ncbi:hypothetical protein GIW23_04450 [Pseudomonas syringae]|nr:hypothetical protein [Pseudomonas syringae]MCF5204584.1 hypothetical protein [Pseudomonas syringae]MCF5269615.1 hypothetical protein [Pseudomonas syringae]MCF5275395.1 hypothetical protein [Pseudomonas syringae]MCF5280000.1 hypothetical protein [Pseudomonas syringae]
MILAGGRGSELVRERVNIIVENASTEIPSSRASSLVSLIKVKSGVRGVDGKLTNRGA